MALFIEHRARILDASRRGKKGLKSVRDTNEGKYRSGEGGEEPPYTVVTLDLSFA